MVKKAFEGVPVVILYSSRKTPVYGADITR